MKENNRKLKNKSQRRNNRNPKKIKKEGKQKKIRRIFKNEGESKM